MSPFSSGKLHIHIFNDSKRSAKFTLAFPFHHVTKNKNLFLSASLIVCKLLSHLWSCQPVDLPPAQDRLSLNPQSPFLFRSLPKPGCSSDVSQVAFMAVQGFPSYKHHLRFSSPSLTSLTATRQPAFSAPHHCPFPIQTILIHVWPADTKVPCAVNIYIALLEAPW